jgi:Mg-chelatase subunit ChlD
MVNVYLIQVVDGYFVHFFAPRGMEPIPKDVLFILDVSGSMSGTKMGQQKAAILLILDDLHEGDRFNIMKFSSGVSFWRPSEIATASRDTVASAKEYVSGLVAQGCKCLLLGFCKSFCKNLLFS